MGRGNYMEEQKTTVKASGGLSLTALKKQAAAVPAATNTLY